MVSPAMAVSEVLTAILLLGLFVLASAVARAYTLWAQRLYIPASVLAGVAALLLGPEVLGRVMGSPFADGAGLFPSYVYEAWAQMPGLLISVVFAALFLGRPIPGLRQIWLRAGPQVVVGQTMAWGQYVVGILLTWLILTPVFDISPLAGALIEIGFEGGHGTAAGMAATFEELGFPAGGDLALGLATVGLVGGVVVGTVLINVAVRRGMIEPQARGEGTGAEQERFSDRELHRLRHERRRESSTTDPFTVHLGLVALAVSLGWVFLQALQALEAVTWGGEDGVQVLAHVPLFPMAMLGGVILQVGIDRAGFAEYVSERTMARISGTALDLTIVAALATLSLATLGAYWVPFLLLAAAGLAWSLFVLLAIAPRVIPYGWLERGIGDFGQSMGVTVTGVLLMRVADPGNRSGALESFGYKQLLFEPVVGGGLFTAASVPLIAQLGPASVLLMAGGITSGWLLVGLVYFGRMVPARGRGRLRRDGGR